MTTDERKERLARLTDEYEKSMKLTLAKLGHHDVGAPVRAWAEIAAANWLDTLELAERLMPFATPSSLDVLEKLIAGETPAALPLDALPPHDREPGEEG